MNEGFYLLLRPMEYNKFTVMLKKPVLGTLHFVALCVILPEVDVRRCVCCNHIKRWT